MQQRHLGPRGDPELRPLGTCWNRSRGPRLQGANWPPLPALPVAEVHRLESSTGATVVDVRPYVEYAAGHVAGSLSIALRGAFVSWLGWVVPGGVPLIFVLDQEQDRAELVRHCLNVGYDELLGELEGESMPGEPPACRWRRSRSSPPRPSPRR